MPTETVNSLARVCKQCNCTFKIKFEERNSARKYCGRKCYFKASENTPEDFWKLVDKGEGDGCWIWKGTISTRGYGRTCANGKFNLAHRWSWELVNGPVPDNLLVCHRCDNPPCVNPSHLFLGDHQQNMDDMIQKKRSVYGEKHKASKLTEAKVREIKSLLGSGVSCYKLAKFHKVAPETIYDIRDGVTWKQVV